MCTKKAVFTIILKALADFTFKVYSHSNILKNPPRDV